MYIRHCSHYSDPYLADLNLTRSFSYYVDTLIRNNVCVPECAYPDIRLLLPRWTLLVTSVFPGVPGGDARDRSPRVLRLLSVSIMSDRHNFRTHVYADGSLSSSSAPVSVVIASYNVTLNQELSHVPYSTASQLAAILGGVRHKLSQLPYHSCSHNAQISMVRSQLWKYLKE